MSQPPHYPAIPMLYTSGTYYDVGYNVGVTFGNRIHRYWNESQEVIKIHKPFNETMKGQEYYDKTLAVCRDNFPQFIRELEGIADGACMPFRQIFILNISKEVRNVLSRGKRTLINEDFGESNIGVTADSSGCSDILVNKPGCKLLAHNEDCDPMIKPYGYLLRARVVEDGKEMENFTSFCYPGMLAGCAFSFNTHGLVFSMDGLYTSFIVQGAPTRLFVNRSVIRARSVDEAMTLLKNRGYGVAYAFTVNIADLNRPGSMWSIEVGPQSPESNLHVLEIPEGDASGVENDSCYYMHFNCIKHLNLPEITPRNSSNSRSEAAHKLPPPTDMAGIMRILGDTSNPDYPIFRTDRPTDHSETVFTAVVDVMANKVDFFQNNPALQDIKSVMSFNILEK